MVCRVGDNYASPYAQLRADCIVESDFGASCSFSYEVCDIGVFGWGTLCFQYSTM